MFLTSSIRTHGLNIPQKSCVHKHTLGTHISPQHGADVSNQQEYLMNHVQVKLQPKTKHKTYIFCIKKMKPVFGPHFFTTIKHFFLYFYSQKWFRLYSNDWTAFWLYYNTTYTLYDYVSTNYGQVFNYAHPFHIAILRTHIHTQKEICFFLIQGEIRPGHVLGRFHEILIM